MGISAILLIAVSLAMDAFAVSISNGVCIRGFGKKDAIKQAAFFGGFQFIMPVIGWFLGNSVKTYIEAVDHWIAFILLLLIGVNMIHESLRGEEEEKRGYCSLTNKMLFIQAVATSIDALAVGISFAILDVNILQAGVIIGIVAFVISCIGACAGKYLGDRLQTKAEIVGGVVLILIGSKILIEHTLLGVS